MNVTIIKHFLPSQNEDIIERGYDTNEIKVNFVSEKYYS